MDRTISSSYTNGLFYHHYEILLNKTTWSPIPSKMVCFSFSNGGSKGINVKRTLAFSYLSKDK